MALTTGKPAATHRAGVASVRPDEDRAWIRYGLTGAVTLLAGLALALLFVLLADPYGVSPIRLVSTDYLARTQRRFIVPQLARDQRYDSFLVGTSTLNAVDPAWAAAEFSGRFANLAVHGATPYEQARLLELLARRRTPPRTVILGLDRVWCSPGAVQRHHPKAALPEWLFDDGFAGHVRHLLNGHALSLSLRKVLLFLRLEPQKVRADGYHDELPPEATWTPDRAAAVIAAAQPEPEATQDGTTVRLPAIDLLGETLATFPQPTQLIAVLMPAYMPPTAGPEPAALRHCKTQLATLLRGRGGRLVDFLWPSAWTTQADNYWDPLHFRQPISRALPGQIHRASLLPPGAGSEVFRVP